MKRVKKKNGPVFLFSALMNITEVVPFYFLWIDIVYTVLKYCTTV